MINRKRLSPKITNNKIIMSIAREYVKEKDLLNGFWDEINLIRIYKKMILLLELVGVKGRCRIEAYDNVNKKSLLKWKIDFSKVKKLRKKAIEIWKEFLK